MDTNSVKSLINYAEDVEKIQSVVLAFLQYQKRPLKEDYTLDELEKFFDEIYSRECCSNKEVLALWNFHKVIDKFRGASV